MDEQATWRQLLEQVQSGLGHSAGSTPKRLQELLRAQTPADITMVLEELDPDEARRAFAALDEKCRPVVLGMLGSDLGRTIADSLGKEELDRLIDQLPSREAASLLAERSRQEIGITDKAGIVPAAVVEDARRRSTYPQGSVGRLMTTQFVRLHADMTIAEALGAVRKTDAQQDLPDDMCVVERDAGAAPSGDRLVGVISIRDTVMALPGLKVRDVMSADPIRVNANTDALDAARLLSKLKFLALPVTDDDGILLGLVPAEDLMQAAMARLHERYAQTVGTDAAAMERMSPFQAAVKRVPWLLGTMAIELGAAVIISDFNSILQKVILLASFMPVISAVSGNVGLQAAAITIRGLDLGQTSLRRALPALLKEAATTLFMAVVCGVVLGLIGAAWSQRLPFGLVIGLALTCSMLTASCMGTLFPMISKKLGFDPAATAGPFETAFQDVVGFGVFLGLASLFAGYM